MINTKTMTSEMIQDQGDNPYKSVVLNNVYKVPEKCPEMKNWSIFSDNVRYVQHDKMTTQNLGLDTLDYRKHKDYIILYIILYSIPGRRSTLFELKYLLIEKIYKVIK